MDISQGHSLEHISKVMGFKDWNTASVASKPKKNELSFPIQISTVGDIKQVLELFDDSYTIDADYEFKLGDFLDLIDPMDEPEDTILQEFSLSFESFNEDIVTFKLKLEDESSTTTFE